jgi:hypothetical protein
MVTKPQPYPTQTKRLWGFFVFSLVLIRFPLCSQFVPHVLGMFFDMLSITPFFYPICFNKCCFFLTYIDEPKGRSTTLLLFWGLLNVYCNLMKFNYHLCNYLTCKFDDLLINRISWFNLIIVFDVHIFIYVKIMWKSLHFIMHVKSHGGPCDV